MFQKAKTYIEELRRSSYVMDAASSFAMPGRQNDFAGFQFQPEGSSEIVTTKTMVLGDRLPEILKLELLEGKWFAEETNDSLSIILNESALSLMNVDDPIGRRLTAVQQTPNGNVTLTFTIIGIVRDFNFQSFRDQITPLVIQSNENFGGALGYVMAKIKPGEIPNAIELAEAKWKEIFPDQPFKFTFLDQDINAKYAEDQRTGELFAVFSGLAIFVACIGLFALSLLYCQFENERNWNKKSTGSNCI